jgi:hypothetical protein
VPCASRALRLELLRVPEIELFASGGAPTTIDLDTPRRSMLLCVVKGLFGGCGQTSDGPLV